MADVLDDIHQLLRVQGLTPGLPMCDAAEVLRRAAEEIERLGGGAQTSAPPLARCQTCGGARTIPAHGGYDMPCPACYAADAEEGLAMLGGAGRG